jgi:hypothetical protein
VSDWLLAVVISIVRAGDQDRWRRAPRLPVRRGPSQNNRSCGIHGSQPRRGGLRSGPPYACISTVETARASETDVGHHRYGMPAIVCKNVCTRA